MSPRSSAGPVIVLGSSGSGRTARLAAIAAHHAGEVIDDVDRLHDDEISDLRSRVEGGADLLLAALELRTGHPALDRLTAAVARHGRVEVCGAPSDELITTIAADRLGRAIPTDLVPVLRRASGANLALVDAIVRGWSEAGLPDPSADDPVSIAPVTAALVAGRSAGLGSLAVQLADVLAVVGDVPAEDACRVLGVDRDDLTAAHDELIVAGLADRETLRLFSIVADVRAAALGPTRRQALIERVAMRQHERGVAPAALAPMLRAGRAVGLAAAAAFAAAGDAVRMSEPDVAESWYDDAVLAGAAEADVALGRAEARTVAGGEGAWSALGEARPSTATQRQRHDLCVAALLAVEGRMGRAADQLIKADAADAATAFLVGSGQPAPAAASGRDLPAAEARAISLLGELARAAVDGRVEGPVPAGFEAVDAAHNSRWSSPVVDSPHAVAAMAALTVHDHASAESMLDRAVATDFGGGGFAWRHRGLLAWVHLRAGRYDSALQLVAESGDGERLGGRDRLVLVAIEALLARRSGDVPGQLAAWRRAEPLLARQGIDLWSLDQWSELIIAGARVGAVDRVTPALAEIDSLVDAHGQPPAYRLAVAWLRTQCAVVTDDATAARNAADLAAAVPRTRQSFGAVAAAAGAWAGVLAGSFDRESVDDAAQGLVQIGWPWDASRLLGQAAIRSTDAGETRALLERARDLKAPSAPETAMTADAGGLSEREVEVAVRLLDGMTHKEIGAQLFISAKTVEHHVARIRTKLGAGSRAELVAQLRTLLRR